MAFSLRTLFRKDQNDLSQSDNTAMPLIGGAAPLSMQDRGAFPAALAGGRGGVSPFQIATPRSPSGVSADNQILSPMNAVAPFPPVTEEGFTVRELGILLPPQLLQQNGLPPDYIVPLPLDEMRQSYEQGRPCLKLSQIYRACPYLFSPQISQAEDQEVALPLQKVRRILEGAFPSMKQAASPPPQQIGMKAPTPPQFNGQNGAPKPASPFQLQSSSNAATPVSPFSMAPKQPAENAADLPSHQQPVNSPFQFSGAAQNFPPSPSANPSRTLASPAPQQRPAASPFQLAPKTPLTEETRQPASPFQPAASPLNVQPSPFKLNVAGNVPVFSAGSAPSEPQTQPQAASPFALSEKLVAGPMPPALPAPVSSSPFQIAPTAAPAAFPAVSLPPLQSQPTVPAFTGTSPFALTSNNSQAAPSARHPEARQQTPFERPIPASAPILVRSQPPVPGSPLAGLTPPALAPLPSAPSPVLPPPVDEPLPQLLAPVAEAPPAPEPPEDEMVVLKLSSVLRSLNPSDLGFDPVNVPDSVSVELPLHRILPQLATGKVAVPMSDVTSGVAEKFRPAFARARTDLQVTLPLSELFHALPSGAIPPVKPAATFQAAPMMSFTTPFADKAREDATRVPSPVPVHPMLRPLAAQAEISSPPAFAPAANHSPAPNFVGAHEDLGSPRSADTLSAPPPRDLPLRGSAPVISLPPLLKPVGELSPPPVQFQPSPQERYEEQEEEELAATEEPAGATASVVEEPALVKELPVLVATPVQAQPPVISPPAARASQDLQFGYAEKVEDLTVRYLLGSETALSLHEVASRIAKLDGIQGCVVLATNSTEQGGEAEACESFWNSAPQAYQSLISLAESIGMQPQGTFTLRADQMVRTFFLEGGVCIGVLHSAPQFQAGVRDKLILITRELGRIHS